MSNHTCKIVLNRQKIDKEEKCPLVLQAFINKKRVRISIGVRVKPQNFNIDFQRVLIPENKSLSNALNAKIEAYLSKAKMIFIRYELDGEKLSLNKFIDLIRDKTSESKKLTVFIDEQIEIYKSIRAKGTIKTYNKFKNKILDFRPNVELVDIDYQFLVGLEVFLKKQTLSVNTIAAHHKALRFFINEAIRLKILFENPYENFKVKKRKTERMYLTRNELKSLMNLYNDHSLTPSKQEILRAFLFMCFTSIRFSDVKALTDENIINNVLVFTVQKTTNSKRIHKIDLNQTALSLLDNRKGKIFNIPSGQKFNLALKRIAMLGGVDKGITSHVARHSFATHFLATGGDLHILQKIMDHERVETTMVYVHILDKEPQKQIENLSNSFL